MESRDFPVVIVLIKCSVFQDNVRGEAFSVGQRMSLMGRFDGTSVLVGRALALPDQHTLPWIRGCNTSLKLSIVCRCMHI